MNAKLATRLLAVERVRRAQPIRPPSLPYLPSGVAIALGDRLRALLETEAEGETFWEGLDAIHPVAELCALLRDKEGRASMGIGCAELVAVAKRFAREDD